MERRIYRDGSDCLYVATSISEAAEIADCDESEITAWTDDEMSRPVVSDADMEKYGVMPESWAELAEREEVGFLLDLSEPHDSIAA